MPYLFKILLIQSWYCNVNQYKAKQLMNLKRIENVEQVNNLFKSSVFYAWNNMDWLLDTGNIKCTSILSLVRSGTKNVLIRRRNLI